MIRIRSSFVFAGIVLALTFTGCAGSSGGKTARGSMKAAPKPAGTTLAIVGGRAITNRDIDSVLAGAPQGIRENYLKDAEMYKVLVDRVVQQEMTLLAAKKDGIENDSAYLADVASQRRQLLMKHYYQHVVAKVPPVSEAAIREYYDAHQADLSMPGRVRVRHIQVATQARAKEVIRKLKTATWETVCARYSTDKATAKSGGVLGFVTTDSDLVPGVGKASAIVAAAFKLKEGETSEPLKSERAWHVIRAEEKTEAGTRPLEQVKKQIQETLGGESSEKFQNALLDSLKRVYGVVVYADSIEAAMAPVATPAQLFASAQAAQSPQKRISIFQQVVSKYPNDKSAIQAAFMIGFTYAEELRDFPAARVAFEDFLKKYPKSDLVGSAKWMLENMEHSAPPPNIGVPDTLQFEFKQPVGNTTKP
jgi:peptidyl-prolyl cis-trans isomerase C